MRSLLAIAMLIASIQVAQAQEADTTGGTETTIQCTLNTDGTSTCQ
jgi:hypothetical protein